ncbi:MAG: hypothetical protein IJX94_02840 [Clostridia bacterium]|nr:hypothetical protein [Clostridia bacterium]
MKKFIPVVVIKEIGAGTVVNAEQCEAAVKQPLQSRLQITGLTAFVSSGTPSTR